MPTTGAFNRYVGKFCYSYDPDGNSVGTLEVNVTGGDLFIKDLYFLTFDDQPKHWDEAVKDWDNTTCDKLVDAASGVHRVAFSEFGYYSNLIQITGRLRPRFWYFSFVACSGSDAGELLATFSYDIHLLNPAQGFQEEFSVDQEGTVLLQSAACGSFLCLALGMFYAAKRCGSGSALRSRPVLRLSLVSAAFSALGAACRTTHMAVFALDGQGWGAVDVIGQLWICAAKAMFALQLLLAAKGWSFFYGRGEFLSRWGTLCILGLLLVTSAACEIHANWALDWSPSLYLYENWSGALVLGLNMLLFVEGARSMYVTYMKEQSEEVRAFYATVSRAAFVYFVSLPVLTVCSSLLNPWLRFKYVDRIEVLSRFFATSMLALALRPGRIEAMMPGGTELLSSGIIATGQAS